MRNLYHDYVINIEYIFDTYNKTIFLYQEPSNSCVTPNCQAKSIINLQNKDHPNKITSYQIIMC
jgi:hypothetical protein